MSARFTASGIITISATRLWWNSFYFELTPYGIEILGFDKSRLANDKYVQFSLAADASHSSTDLLDENDVFIFNAPQDAVKGTFLETLSDHSIFRYAEHRLRVEVDADLSIPSNILIENGKQKMHYNIGSYAISHEYFGEITIANNFTVLDEIKLQSPIFIGNTVVKSKTDPTTDWYTIVSSSNVQNMRLTVIVLRREWNRISEKWKLVRSKLKMDPKAMWSCTLKFVQTF